MQEADQTVADAMRKVDQGIPGDLIPGLRMRLAPLYGSIFSDELSAILAEAAIRKPGAPAPILRLHLLGGMDIVPWEVLFKRDFLGLEFQVARMPIVPGGPIRGGKVRKVTRISSLLGEQVVDDDLRPAWDGTFDGTINGAVTLWKSPAAAADWPTATNLPEAFGEILHVTCHGLASDTGERYWSLNKNLPGDSSVSVYPKDGENNFRLPALAPLVFANACSSASAAPVAGASGAFGEGFGTTFYDLGASVFVGTIAPVSKTVALELAKRFFRRLLGDGLPVGEALWRTKLSFAEEGERDPSWLFYCMYGEPETRFVPGGSNG
jgi:hypothetical protein